MLAFSVKESHIKKFMDELLRKDTFNDYEIREASVSGFVKFTIDGMLSRNSGQEDNRYFAAWAELKPYVFDFIKGRCKPKNIKIIFSKDASFTKNFHPNCASLFLNMNYEADQINFTTATSQKEFILNKDLDRLWEDYILNYFNEINIPITFAE